MRAIWRVFFLMKLFVLAQGAVHVPSGARPATKRRLELIRSVALDNVSHAAHAVHAARAVQPDPPESRAVQPLVDGAPTQREIMEHKADGLKNDHSRCSTDPMTPVLLKEWDVCPPECPYAVSLSAKKCSKVCVSQGRCQDFDPVLHFGDPLTMECVPNCGREIEHRVPGCERCSSIGICEECASGWGFMPGYVLSKDGTQCYNTFHSVVVSIYGVVGVAVAVILYYVAMLFRRNQHDTNHKVLEKALIHRQRCKPTDPDTGDPLPYWSVSVFFDDLCGQGVMQYFTWAAWLMLISAALTIGAYMSYQDSKYLDNLDAMVDDLSCKSSSFLETATELIEADHMLPKHLYMQTGIDPEDPLAKYFDIDWRMFKFLFPTYVIVSLLSLSLAWWQVWYAQKWESNHTGLRHFAVLVRGLHSESTSPTEVLNHIIKHSELPESDFIGVSIAYDVIDCADDLEVLVDDWGKTEPVPKDDLRWYFLSVADKLFVDCEARDTPDPKTLTGDLKGSGAAIVVMQSVEAAHKLIEKATLPPLKEDHDEHLTTDTVRDEPPAVIWTSFTKRNVILEIFKAIFVFIAIIFIWAMLYLPYAMDYIFYASIPGENPGYWEDFILGLLIAVGNAIVGNAVELTVSWVGIRDKGTRDVVVLYVGFCAVFLNTVLDLLLVMEVAKGTSLDGAFEGHRVGYDAALVEGVVAIIIPGYLILPYVVAPIFLYALPYYVSVFIVKSRRVGVREAERSLEAAPFDVLPWRYIDFVNNTMVCLVMLCFTTPQSWVVFATLVFSFFLIIMIDRYLLLRGCSEMMYTSNKLMRNFARLFVLPTASLCAIACWWGVKAGVLPDWSPYAAFGIHCVIYLFLLEACSPVERTMNSKIAHKLAESVHMEQLLERRNTMHNYRDVVNALEADGHFYSYWNTNAAQCLRHRYLKENVPGADPDHLAPYSHGKEVLRMRRSSSQQLP
jgi:hypothetical protein